MTLTPSIQQQADSLIADIFDGLTNRGPVSSFIEPGCSTSDFDLQDKLVLRAKEEKNSVYYHVFRRG